MCLSSSDAKEKTVEDSSYGACDVYSFDGCQFACYVKYFAVYCGCDVTGENGA